jgi:hypothetical protein
MKQIALIALRGLVMCLGGIVAVELHEADMPGLHPAAARQVKPPSQKAAGVAPDRAASWAGTVLARPLFSRTRRPSAIAAPFAASSPGLPRLSGIMISPAGKSAIFSPAGGKPIIAEEGGHVGAFTVRSISANRVTIDGPGGITVLRTVFSGAKASAAPAGASLKRPSLGARPAG